MSEPNINDYPWLIEELGIDQSKLGTVMLPVAFRPGFVEEGYRRGVIDPSDLYESENPNYWWVAGDVTPKAHVTILHGLLTPATEMSSTILRLIGEDTPGGWKRPAWLPITGIEAFPSNLPGENYACVVARVADRGGMLETLRARLSYLPHLHTFAEWKMHATIAYVTPEAAPRWVSWFETGPKSIEVPSNARVPMDLGGDRSVKKQTSSNTRQENTDG